MLWINRPLISERTQQFQQSLGIILTAEQAEVLALAVEEERITLTDIRGLVGGSYREAKAVVDYMVQQQLLEVLDESIFKLPDALKIQLDKSTVSSEFEVGTKTTEVTTEVTSVGTKLEPSWDQVGTKSGPDETAGEL